MPKPHSAQVTSPDSGDGASRPATGYAVLSLAVAMLMSSLGVSIANVALPTLEVAFAASFQAVQWVVLGYLIALTVVIVTAGRLGDTLGRRRVFIAGLFIFTLASLLCAVSPTLTMLIGARVLQGIGAAVLMALTVALVRETVTTEKTGSAMGLLGTMSAVGTALGPSMGGILIDWFDWPSIFLLMAVIGASNILLVVLTGQPQGGSGRGSREVFDKIGTLLLALAIGFFALGTTIGGTEFGLPSLLLLVLALLCLASFILVERRAPSPLIRLSSFRSLTLSASLGMNLLVSTVMMSTLVVGPFYLTHVHGLNESLVGIIVAVGPIVSAITGVLAGKLTDYFGASRVMALGLLEMAIGTFALAFLPGLFGVAGYVAALIVLTPGYQQFQAANNTAVMNQADANERGVVSGMLSLSRNVGLIAGASVMGAVFSLSVGASDITAATSTAVAQGMRNTFVTAGLLVLVALAVASFSRRFESRSGRPARAAADKVRR